MKTIEIHGSTGDSIILISERLRNLREYIPSEKVVIITDTNVRRYYQQDTNVRRYYQQDFPSCEVIEIGTGENIKSLDTVQTIYGKLVDYEADRSSFIVGIGGGVDYEADRSSFIVGIGGGVVCDIAGFVASTYLRGVRFGFVPSTLHQPICEE